MTSSTQSEQAPISNVEARAYSIPTDQPEADGTFAWTKTTLVIVHITAGGKTGFGYTYNDAAAAHLINNSLSKRIIGQNALDTPHTHLLLQQAVRNVGRGGLAACAISAVDLALWDLKSRLLGLNLSSLLGRERTRVQIYGSGGFTSYDDATLAAQLRRWVQDDGCTAVKMKIGTDISRDPQRIATARAAIGDAQLFVDANGALSPRTALALAHVVAESGISWFEEPVSSDNLPGLAMVRAAIPGGIDIAAGEYGFTLDDARAMLAAQAVDVLQCDITRCGGVTGFLRTATLCDAFHTPLSGHCAPSAHLHAACATPRLRHLEWFHDHVRIEQMLFEGAPEAQDGFIEPDLSRPGNGLTLKAKDAEAYAL